MADFTFIEYADMHLMYGLAPRNCLEARMLYAEHFPNRALSNRRMFERIDIRTLKVTACFGDVASINSNNERSGSQSLPKANSLTNKIAVVTGGASAFGIICAKELLRCGAEGVMIVDDDEKKGRQKLSQICQDCESNKVAFIRADMKNVLLLRNAFLNTQKHFGKIDIIVNVTEQSDKMQWSEEIENNVRGTVRCTLLGYEFMGRHKGGAGGTICNLLISPSSEETDLCPILVATRNYVVSFAKAMSTKFNTTTGIKIVTAFAEKARGEMKSVASTGNRESLLTMLEGSQPGSVWTLHFIKRKQ